MDPTDTDTPPADDAAGLLARDCSQLLDLSAQLREQLADDAAEADRSALVGRIGGRLRALAAIESEVAEPTAAAEQRHARMATLAQQLAATDGSRGDALDALERELREHAAAMPPLQRSAASADPAALCERIRTRRAELLLDEKPD